MTIKDRLSAKQRRNLYWILNLLPDSWVIRLVYYASLGRWPNVNKPKRFTEKLQWYKLNYRIPLMTQCADKYRVREYLESKGYGQFLPALYQVCSNIKEINFDSLPTAFAIKCNNGCGTNIFITDKAKMDLKAILAIGNSWHTVNTIAAGREWAYMNIVPKIIVEELLVSTDGTQRNDLNDYKVMCFNSKAKVIWVDVDRRRDHRRNFYDLSWNQLKVISNFPPADLPIPKPYGLEQMIAIAEDIAKDFPFVRVDFYSLNHKIYIGELTFYPWSGYVSYIPDSFDYELGNYFVLPPKTIARE